MLAFDVSVVCAPRWLVSAATRASALKRSRCRPIGPSVRGALINTCRARGAPEQFGPLKSKPRLPILESVRVMVRRPSLFPSAPRVPRSTVARRRAAEAWAHAWQLEAGSNRHRPRRWLVRTVLDHDTDQLELDHREDHERRALGSRRVADQRVRALHAGVIDRRRHRIPHASAANLRGSRQLDELVGVCADAGPCRRVPSELQGSRGHTGAPERAGALSRVWTRPVRVLSRNRSALAFSKALF